MITFTTSCATPGRFLIGAGAGAAVGGGTATLLSPNPESRGLNALVFGLVGAIAGGAAAAFLFKDPKPAEKEKDTSIRGRELGTPDLNLYNVPVNPKLPEFVKERLQPVVIEEANEPDTVSEDGTLHAPHKIYRIQHAAELYAKPRLETQTEGKNR